MKIKSSQIGKITLSFTDISKSCPCREFLTSQICVLTLFVKIKFLQKCQNLQYPAQTSGGKTWSGLIQCLLFQRQLIKKKHFLWLSLGSNQYSTGRVNELCVYFMMGAPEGLTESGS